MNKSRGNILNKLRHQQSQPGTLHAPYQPDNNWSQQEKLQRLIQCMSAAHTEVHQLIDSDWVSWLNTELPKRELKRVLVGENETGLTFKQQADPVLQVQCYDQKIETWKDQLFHQVDVSITTTRGGIAETGSLIVWPDTKEPRLMSLVPPVHIALLNINSIYENFAEAMNSGNWTSQMPTNALLISGPSKTADIEQTLAYGIHGPKQLIVLIFG